MVTAAVIIEWRNKVNGKPNEKTGELYFGYFTYESKGIKFLSDKFKGDAKVYK